MPTHSGNVLVMLQELAAKEVKEAALALAKVMKLANEAQAKQVMLNEYRQDYVLNFNKVLETGLEAKSYQNFQNFFAKLDQAITGQTQVIEIANRQVSVHKQLWQESQRKKLSFEVLTERSEKRVLKIELKKDQKLMDEFAMRITRVKTN